MRVTNALAGIRGVMPHSLPNEAADDCFWHLADLRADRPHVSF